MWKIINDNRGSASIVLLILFLPIIVLSFFYMTEHKMIYNSYAIIENAVTISALSALTQMDMIELAYGNPDVNPTDARNIFNNMLAANLKLNSDLSPAGENFIVAPLQVHEFRVYNTSDLPADCPRGVHLTSPTIHVVVEAKIRRPVFRALFGNEITIIIHKDVDNTTI